jgi:hypothetical protein
MRAARELRRRKGRSAPKPLGFGPEAGCGPRRLGSASEQGRDRTSSRVGFVLDHVMRHHDQTSTGGLDCKPLPAVVLER